MNVNREMYQDETLEYRGETIYILKYFSRKDGWEQKEYTIETICGSNIYTYEKLELTGGKYESVSCMYGHIESEHAYKFISEYQVPYNFYRLPRQELKIITITEDSKYLITKYLSNRSNIKIDELIVGSKYLVVAYDQNLDYVPTYYHITKVSDMIDLILNKFSDKK